MPQVKSAPERGVVSVPADKKAIEAKIEDKFAEAMSTVTAKDQIKPDVTNTDDMPTKKPARQPKQKEEEKPEVEEVPAEEEPAEQTPEEKTLAAEKKTKPKDQEAAAEAPTLPDNHRRSLKALKWTDEEIEQGIKEYGPGFYKMAEKAHEKRNKEIAEFAEKGRAARQAGQQPPAKTTDTPKPPARQPASRIDVDALKKQVGDDALAEQIASPINEALERIDRHEQRIQREQTAQLGVKIDNFFSDPKRKSFHNIYGKGSADLSEDQRSKRQKVLEVADAVVRGGYQFADLEDVLEYAFDAVSGDDKLEIAREELRGQLKKRQSGLSIKPRAGSGPVKEDPKADREKRVGEGLKKIFQRA